MLRNFIASQFKKPTGLFGLFSSNMMIKGNKDKYDKLIKEMVLCAHDKILEIGYGPGMGINKIAETYATCTIHGIDFSPLMFKKACKYNEAYIDKGSVVLQQGDFLTMPITGNGYDKIFCLNVVYFWNDLTAPFEKVFSLLKKGGAFHIYMADRNTLIEKKAPDSVFNKYSIEQITEALKLTGFTETDYRSEKGYYIKAKK